MSGRCFQRSMLTTYTWVWVECGNANTFPCTRCSYREVAQASDGMARCSPRSRRGHP